MTPALEAAQQLADAPAPMMQTAAGGGGAASETAKATTITLGSPWTSEEHLAFLQGLATLGKGRWKEISRSFVIT